MVQRDFVGQIQAVRSEGWAGLYLMSPGTVGPIIDVLAAGLERASCHV